MKKLRNSESGGGSACDDDDSNDDDDGPGKGRICMCEKTFLFRQQVSYLSCVSATMGDSNEVVLEELQQFKMSPI